MWDGEFCGSLTFQWQEGSNELPEHIPGHVEFGVVPWKRGQGYAAQSLSMLLPDAKRRGLSFVQLSVEEENVAARRSIELAGGTLAESGPRTSTTLQYRITL
jgi:predicted acetyltransferase